ncbi:hypothetical protein M3J09_007945 [Ascochyta lentis]
MLAHAKLVLPLCCCLTRPRPAWLPASSFDRRWGCGSLIHDAFACQPFIHASIIPSHGSRLPLQIEGHREDEP